MVSEKNWRERNLENAREKLTNIIREKADEPKVWWDLILTDEGTFFYRTNSKNALEFKIKTEQSIEIIIHPNGNAIKENISSLSRSRCIERLVASLTIKGYPSSKSEEPIEYYKGIGNKVKLYENLYTFE